jgi:hypothetical protein
VSNAPDAISAESMIGNGTPACVEAVVANMISDHQNGRVGASGQSRRSGLRRELPSRV